MTTTATSTSRSRLSPDDAYHTLPSIDSLSGRVDDGNAAFLRVGPTRRSRDQRRDRSRSRRRKGNWKKLLWVRQSYPDNYTDEETFLDALQRNPRLRPYEFWPLVTDSTVIVQQVCTMVVFVCCFSGIKQGRVSPITVVSWGTIGTVVGWVLWDIWVGQEHASSPPALAEKDIDERAPPLSPLSPLAKENPGLGLSLSGQSTGSSPRKGLTRTPSANSVRPGAVSDSGSAPPSNPIGSPNLKAQAPGELLQSTFSSHNQQRITTAKSAILIYCALLGLSPILKSLTESTASDSIWAISFWLMCINVIFFDYGGGVGATFPASLSTNAALMASTVLASRLPTTTHVFSLTLFSIEVFGLFPIFRRYLRHISWRGHLSLTWMLVMGAGAGVALTLYGDGWTAALIGMVLGSLLTGLAMGICSWWLIGLQRYKNEIHGPWDPARPIIRRWD